MDVTAASFPVEFEAIMILLPLSVALFLFGECLTLAFFGKHLFQLIIGFGGGNEVDPFGSREEKSYRRHIIVVLPVCLALLLVLGQVAPGKTLAPLHLYYERLYLDLQLIVSALILFFWMLAVFITMLNERRDAESTFTEEERDLLEMDINDRWKILREKPELQDVVDRALRKREALKKDQTNKIRVRKQSNNNPIAWRYTLFGVLLGLLQIGLLAFPVNRETPETWLYLFALALHAGFTGWISGRKILFESSKLSSRNMRLVLSSVISSIRTGGQAQESLKKLVAVYQMLEFHDPFIEELGDLLSDRHITFDKVLGAVSRGAESDIKKFCELTALMYHQGASLRSALEDLKQSPSVVYSSAQFLEPSALQSGIGQGADPSELLVFLEALRRELKQGNDLVTSFSAAMAFAPQSEVFAGGLQSIQDLLSKRSDANMAVSQLKLSTKRSGAMTTFAIVVLYAQYFPQTFPLQLDDLIEQFKIASTRR